eukprot:8663103-Karenia_brevis.AAC.1
MADTDYKFNWDDGVVDVASLECIKVEVVSESQPPTLVWKNSVVNKYNVPKERIASAFKQAVAPRSKSSDELWCG